MSVLNRVRIDPDASPQETNMRKTRWIAATGMLLATASAYAGPGLPYAHDDTSYPDDGVDASRPRRIEVAITDRGPQPRSIRVVGRERIELVLTRESPNACRGDVVIPELNSRTTVPAGPPVALALLAPGPGEIHVSCPLEDIPGAM
jgi:hypothetical protein